MKRRSNMMATKTAQAEAPKTADLPPRELRRTRRVPMIWIAATAQVAEATVRVYEADRDRVTEAKRHALDRVYAELAQRPAVLP